MYHNVRKMYFFRVLNLKKNCFQKSDLIIKSKKKKILMKLFFFQMYPLLGLRC